MRWARLYAVLAVAAGVGAGVLLWPSPPAASAVPAAAPNYFAFVPSMLGTRPDGAARVDASNLLIVNAELAYLFDYYLAGLGERPLEAIRAEILRELARRLPPAANAEAQRLLDAYLAYKRALADVEHGLQQAPASPAAVTASADANDATRRAAQRARQRLTAMQQLRHNYFSEQEIAGLFSASDAYDLDAIARLELAAENTLSADQRQRQLSALDARLPVEARAERDAPAAVIRLEDTVAKARAQGADDNDIYRLRAATLSSSAADRLAEVDREQADWQRRISTYQTQRQQLLQSASSQAALQQLRDAGFTPAEQKRLPAYEQ